MLNENNDCLKLKRVLQKTRLPWPHAYLKLSKLEKNKYETVHEAVHADSFDPVDVVYYVGSKSAISQLARLGYKEEIQNELDGASADLLGSVGPSRQSRQFQCRP